RVGAISHPDLRVSRRFISPSLFPCCAPTHGVGRRLDEYPANVLKRNRCKIVAALRTFANAAITASLAVESLRRGVCGRWSQGRPCAITSSRRAGSRRERRAIAFGYGGRADMLARAAG